MDVTHRLEPDLRPEAFLDLLARSDLAERRPVDEPETIRGMLRHADTLVAARAEVRLVGIARAITAFAHCTYLSDLAVDERSQRRGIGKELIRRPHEAAGLQTTLILLAAPKSRGYYPHIGMTSRDRHVWLEEREFLVVPRGVEHRPVVDDEAHVLLFEPAGTLNTGDVRDGRTAHVPERS